MWILSQQKNALGVTPGDARRPKKVERQIGLHDIFSLKQPRDLMMRAVRAQQIDTILRLAPVTIAIQLLCGAVLLAALSSSVDNRELLAWFVVAGAICAVRVGRAWRLRSDADYEKRVPATFLSATLTVGFLSIFWLIPPILWFDDATSSSQLLMAVVSAVLVSAGSLTFISVPPAALAYVTVTLASTLIIALKLQNTPMAALTIVYGLAVIIAIIASARQFIAKTRASIALEEQSEIITILREFEASGSGGLWELDHQMRLVKLSEDLASQIGTNASSLIGIQVRKLLDPLNRVTELSSGMQDLFRHLHEGTPFRDIAIPGVATDRWWAVSGRPTRDRSGRVIGWRGVASDITDVRLTGIDSVREARRDPLTGIANRLLLRELLEEMILENLDEPDRGALLMVDLDRFKLSMIRWAMPLETACCAKPPGALKLLLAMTDMSAVWAATNLPSSGTGQTTRRRYAISRAA
ncbi:MAG: sensor domain-containing diguanylate cyclase [Sphingomonadaceae bacterium]|nr:MAG: sensor domain-containing diguanylate cyclase [Sphingomonadaceae bacterium]